MRVNNTLIITDHDIKEVDIFNKFGDVDFNKINKIPYALVKPTNPDLMAGIYHILTKGFKCPIEESSYYDNPLVKKFFDFSLAKIKECERVCSMIFYEDKEALLKDAKGALDNIEVYGAPTFLEWCKINWGTKWNAMYTKLINTDGYKAVTFITEDLAPFPFYIELSKKYPEFEFRVIADFDEEINVNSKHEITIVNGKVTNKMDEAFTIGINK